ncbi:hypothetical protein BCR42DRAFT_401789 [Absidia repens]|uniref:CDT1 Geminin-binding domain-containing protein n=1 Tax=Absidia repens TaxID=90262 RepID=A0A1X2J301_9FUNG|nr:hypothetical protein BCR42DRAFT_401789 [Absidia repens]
MSSPAQQTRLSLRLRKRNQERCEDALPVSKKQAKIISEDTQLRQESSAFGAPILEEERKITKRSIKNQTPTADEAPKKKQNTRQATIKDLLKSSPPPTTTPSTNSSTAEIDSTKPKSIATDKTEKAIEERAASLPIESKESNTTALATSTETLTPTTKAVTSPGQETVTSDRSYQSTLHSPSRSPTLVYSPTEEHNSLHEKSLPDVVDNCSLPSPMTTPETTRTAKATTMTMPSQSTPSMFEESSPSKPQVDVTTSPSSSTKVHDKSLSSKERITEEQHTLEKLVSALDITLIFHAARNVAAFFHKIQPMLRNSTSKNITISHLCKILFVAPELYDVETKLLKEFGKELEAHQVSIGHDWTMPLSGKAIQERKDLMTKRSGDYYEEHKETNARIPEKQLPGLEKVVDKKKWLDRAKLPDRVRAVLELQEKRKAAKEEKASQPRIEPKGTAKDRAKALLERIRNKQKK